MRRNLRKVDPLTIQIAELIDREVAARCGPDVTFEQRQEFAAAVAAEVALQRGRSGPDPKAEG